MKKNRAAFGLVVLLFVVSCGGGGGGSDSNNNQAGFSGQWLAVNSYTTSSCGGGAGLSEQYLLAVTQNGNQVTVTTPHGDLSGSVDSDHASWTGQYYWSEKGQWVTITFLDAQFDASGFSGTYNWEWRASQNGSISCSGTGTITGTRPQISIPDAPSNLVATATDSTTIHLNWEDKSSNEDGFRIYHPHFSIVSPRKLIGTVGPGATTFDATGLIPEQVYRFEVTAFNAGGESFASNIASDTTPAPPIPLPAPPTNLGAFPLSSSEVALSWDDNSSDEDGFRVYRGTTSTTINSLAGSVAADSTSYLDTGRSTGVTYYYQVRAHNAGGESSSSSVSIELASPEGDYSYTIQGYIAPCGNQQYLPVNLTGTATVYEGGTRQLSIVTDHGTLGGTYVGRTSDYVVFSITGQLSNNVIVSNLYLSADHDWTSMTLVGGTMLYGQCGGPFTAATFTRIVLPPADPSSLSATPVSSTSIGLSWSDNSNNETGFKVFRGSTSASINTMIANLGVGATGYNDNNLTPSTTYFYQVAAYNSGGESGRSNWDSARTQDPPATVPVQPSGLVATPVSSTRIDLAWYDNSNNETGFKIYRGTTSSNLTLLIGTIPAGQTGYSDMAVSANTTYYYRVTAYNSAGESSPSNTANATTPPVSTTLPAPPSGLTATPNSSTQVTLSWTNNANNQDGFYIYQAPGSCSNNFQQLGSVGASVTSEPITGLSPGTTVCYKITAFNSAGESSYSNTALTTTPTTGGVPTPPTGLVATETSLSSVDLTWNDSQGEDRYWIELSRDGGSTWTQLPNSLPANTTLDPLTELAPCTNWSIRIRAQNSSGYSGYSNVVPWYTGLTAVLEVQAGQGNFTLSPGVYNVGCWDAGTNMGGIGIYDNDANGLFDSESGNTSYVFPRANVRDCSTCSTWHLESGKAFYSGSNLVLFFRLNTWASAVHDNFIAVYVSTSNGTSVSMLGGDMSPWGVFPGIVMWTKTGAPSMAGNYWLPNTQGPGMFQGSASAYIAESAADTGTLYDAGIIIHDMNVPIFND